MFNLVNLNTNNDKLRSSIQIIFADIVQTENLLNEWYVSLNDWY
jgi:hypothetical protein